MPGTERPAGVPESVGQLTDMLRQDGYLADRGLATALFDISRRPQDQIKGPKPLWVGISFINTIGPLAYFFFGRKRQSGEAGPAEADSLTVDGSSAAGFPAVDGSPVVDGSPAADG